MVLAIMSATIIAGVALWHWLSPSAPPVSYKTALVDRGLITATVTATGTVNPVVSVQVGSQVSGKIKALYADFNSVVTRGQAIAQIDPAIYRSRVNQARASLSNSKGALVKAQAALAQRKLELDRMDTLRRQEFVSQADLDLARTNFRDAAAQVEVAQAQVDQAQAALSNAELDLGYTTIYSPVNGIVVSRNVDVGQTVAASLQAPTLFVIAQDLTKMQVYANVSESDIGGVAEEKEAEFTVDAYPTTPFKGTVVQVRNAPISIQNVVTYDVVISVDNSDLKLKPGMTANVSIVTARKDDALRVPNAALRFKPPGVPIEKKKVVWTFGGEGQTRAVPLSAGIADSLFTEVQEGELREGDRVIVGLETSEEPGQKTLPPGFGVGPKIR
jgi:HlyD family secretion protein